MRIESVTVTMMSVEGTLSAHAELGARTGRARTGGGEWRVVSLSEADVALLRSAGEALVSHGDLRHETQFQSGEVHFAVRHAGGTVTWSFLDEGGGGFGAAAPLWRWARAAAR